MPMLAVLKLGQLPHVICINPRTIHFQIDLHIQRRKDLVQHVERLSILRSRIVIWRYFNRKSTWRALTTNSKLLSSDLMFAGKLDIFTMGLFSKSSSLARNCSRARHKRSADLIWKGTFI